MCTNQALQTPATLELDWTLPPSFPFHIDFPIVLELLSQQLLETQLRKDEQHLKRNVAWPNTEIDPP